MMDKTKLEREVREANYKSAAILRSLDSAVSKLEHFRLMMRPLEDYTQRHDEFTNQINEKISALRNLAQISEEARSLVPKLKSPHDVRSHISNMIKGQQLVSYFHKNQSHEDASVILPSLSDAISVGYSECLKLMSDQLAKYTEIYGVTPLDQDNQAQKDMTGPIKSLIELCKYRLPEYINAYRQIRSTLFVKRLEVPLKVRNPYDSGSHYLIVIVRRFVEVLEVEAQLELLLLETDIQETLNSICEKGYGLVISHLDNYLQLPTNIEHCLDVAYHIYRELGKVQDLLGRGAKFVGLQKMHTTLLQKAHVWERNYISVIESLKVNTADIVHPLAVQLATDSRGLEVYPDNLAHASLEAFTFQLFSLFLDTIKLRTRDNNARQAPSAHIFIINNICFFHHVLMPVDFSQKKDLLSRLERELTFEVENYLNLAWGKLRTILTHNENVIQYKKPGVLTSASRKAVKKKFNSFNEQFPETLNFHKGFSLFSKNMINRLRSMTHEIVVTGYQHFLNTFLKVDFTTRKEKYTLYSLNSVESSIMGMYDQAKINM